MAEAKADKGLEQNVRRDGTIAKTISGRAYRHTATHYTYSCSVDWLDAVWQSTVMAIETLCEGSRLIALIPCIFSDRYKKAGRLI